MLGQALSHSSLFLALTIDSSPNNSSLAYTGLAQMQRAKLFPRPTLGKIPKLILTQLGANIVPSLPAAGISEFQTR